MTELLIEVAKSLAVVTAFIWITCGIIGLVMLVRFLVWEWKYRRSLFKVYEQEDEDLEDYEDGEVTYV